MKDNPSNMGTLVTHSVLALFNMVYGASLVAQTVKNLPAG